MTLPGGHSFVYLNLFIIRVSAMWHWVDALHGFLYACTPSGVRYKRSIDELSLIMLLLLFSHPMTNIYKVNFLLARVGPRKRLGKSVLCISRLEKITFERRGRTGGKSLDNGVSARLPWFDVIAIARPGRLTGNHMADRWPGGSPDGRWKD